MMPPTTRPVVFALLQLTASCVCQKFGVVYRRPVTTDKHMIATVRQQYMGAEDSAYQPQQQWSTGVAEQFYQPSAAGGQSYYVQQQKQLLEQQQLSRLRQQQLQLQQFQQFQLQQQQQQLPSSYYQPQQQPPASYYQSQQQQQQQQQQQYDDLYQQQLLQQQQYYQQKPLFRPTIPVNETPVEGQLQQAASEQQQTSPSTSNLLGVLYSSAADVSKFQFSGNGVSYSF